MEPYASPTCFKNRLKRMTRPQHTGIQTFSEFSGLIRPSRLSSGQSIYRNGAAREFSFGWKEFSSSARNVVHGPADGLALKLHGRPGQIKILRHRNYLRSAQRKRN